MTTVTMMVLTDYNNSGNGSDMMTLMVTMMVFILAMIMIEMMKALMVRS